MFIGERNMATNSITGRFRDIEVSFSTNGQRILMNLENLAEHERRVRVMYQRLAYQRTRQLDRF